MESLRRLRTFLAPLLILAFGAAVFAALVMSRPEPPAQAGDERTWVVETTVVSCAASARRPSPDPRMSAISGAQPT